MRDAQGASKEYKDSLTGYAEGSCGRAMSGLADVSSIFHLIKFLQV